MFIFCDNFLHTVSKHSTSLSDFQFVATSSIKEQSTDFKLIQRLPFSSKETVLVEILLRLSTHPETISFEWSNCVCWELWLLRVWWSSWDFKLIQRLPIFSEATVLVEFDELVETLHLSRDPQIPVKPDPDSVLVDLQIPVLVDSLMSSLRLWTNSEPTSFQWSNYPWWEFVETLNSCRDHQFTVKQLCLLKVCWACWDFETISSQWSYCARYHHYNSTNLSLYCGH